MKKVGIVTGATGGLGKEFVRVLLQEDTKEIWAATRNEAKLMKLKEEFGNKIVPVCVDLSVASSYVKVMHIMAKFFPQKAVMKMWMRQIKPYIQQKDITI